MGCDRRCFDENGKPLPLTEDMNCETCEGRDKSPQNLPKAEAHDSLLAEVMPLLAALKTMDCGSSACRYAQNKSGQRTNGGCSCLQEIPTNVRIEIEKIWHYFS